MTTKSGRREPVMLTGTALVWGVLALVTEVALFAGLGHLVHHLAGGGTRGIVAAVLALLLGAVGWGLFLAPTARRRLPVPTRTGVCVLAGLLVGGGLVAAGWLAWGIAVVGAGLVCAATQWVMGRSAMSGRTVGDGR